MSETLSGVYKFELVRYMCIYVCIGMCGIIVAHATEELCHSHFLYVPAVSNVLTKNVLKLNCALGFVFSI